MRVGLNTGIKTAKTGYLERIINRIGSSFNKFTSKVQYLVDVARNKYVFDLHKSEDILCLLLGLTTSIYSFSKRVKGMKSSKLKGSAALSATMSIKSLIIFAFNSIVLREIERFIDYKIGEGARMLLVPFSLSLLNAGLDIFILSREKDVVESYFFKPSRWYLIGGIIHYFSNVESVIRKWPETLSNIFSEVAGSTMVAYTFELARRLIPASESTKFFHRFTNVNISSQLLSAITIIILDLLLMFLPEKSLSRLGIKDDVRMAVGGAWISNCVYFLQVILVPFLIWICHRLCAQYGQNKANEKLSSKKAPEKITIIQSIEKVRSNKLVEFLFIYNLFYFAMSSFIQPIFTDLSDNYSRKLAVLSSDPSSAELRVLQVFCTFPSLLMRSKSDIQQFITSCVYSINNVLTALASWWIHYKTAIIPFSGKIRFGDNIMFVWNLLGIILTFLIVMDRNNHHIVLPQDSSFVFFLTIIANICIALNRGIKYTVIDQMKEFVFVNNTNIDKQTKKAFDVLSVRIGRILGSFSGHAGTMIGQFLGTEDFLSFGSMAIHMSILSSFIYFVKSRGERIISQNEGGKTQYKK